MAASKSPASVHLAVTFFFHSLTIMVPGANLAARIAPTCCSSSATPRVQIPPRNQLQVPLRSQLLQLQLLGSFALIQPSLGDVQICGTAHAAAVLHTCIQTIEAQLLGIVRPHRHSTHNRSNSECREIRSLIYICIVTLC